MFVICCDSIEKVKKFAAELGTPFPVLSDPDRVAASNFGVDRAFGLSRRHTFFFGPEGMKSHGKDVAIKLEKLGFPKK